MGFITGILRYMHIELNKGTNHTNVRDEEQEVEGRRCGYAASQYVRE
jgi:hypothetical protein